MPPGSGLEQIASLVDRLAPLAGKSRGMPIEADDWNAVIDTLRGLLSIDRQQEESAQTDLDVNYARKVHQHLGEVGIAWLDTDLQARLGSGDPAGSVSTRALLSGMDRKVADLGADVARLTTGVETQQRLLDQTSAGDLDRQKTLRDFETRFAATENLRTSVATLTQQVDGLTKNLDTVLKLRQSLSDAAGQPIDVARLQSAVTDLQSLGENFKGVDGQPVRLRDVELQLREVQDALDIGGAGGLQTRLNGLVGQSETRLNDRLTAQVGDLRTELQKASQDALAGIKAELDSGLAGTLSQARTELAAVASNLKDGQAAALNALTTTLRGEIAAARAAATDDALNRATALVTDLRSELNKTLDTRLGALQDSLIKRFTDQIGTETSRLNDTFTAQIKRLDAAIQELQRRG